MNIKQQNCVTAILVQQNKLSRLGLFDQNVFYLFKDIVYKGLQKIVPEEVEPNNFPFEVNSI